MRKVSIYHVSSYKMDLSNLPINLETITLNEQTSYRLNEIDKIKDYVESEIKDQEILIKKLSKYITGFDYTDKILTGFLTVFSGVNIFSHVKKRKHAVLISVFSLFFCLSAGVIKNYCTKQRKERKNTINYFIWPKKIRLY